MTQNTLEHQRTVPAGTLHKTDHLKKILRRYMKAPPWIRLLLLPLNTCCRHMTYWDQTTSANAKYPGFPPDPCSVAMINVIHIICKWFQCLGLSSSKVVEKKLKIVSNKGTTLKITKYLLKNKHWHYSQFVESVCWF